MPITKIRGSTQIKPLTITNAEVASNAAIQLSKIEDGLELIKRNGSISFTGNLNLGDNKIVSLATPTAASDAANKSYVDSSILSGIGSANLDDLSDVILSNKQNGQVLTYESATDSWKNVIPATAPVTSVNTKTGTVVLDFTDVGAAPLIHIHSDATTTVSGFLSATDKVKLDTIATGAEVNVNSDWLAISGDAQILNRPLVVDNLTSTSATDVLSAKQGKTLQDNKADKAAVEDLKLDQSGRSPIFTYTAGNLTRIDYSNGTYKLFTYSGGNLSQLVYNKLYVTITKVFTYNPDGSLANIQQTETY